MDRLPDPKLCLGSKGRSLILKNWYFHRGELCGDLHGYKEFSIFVQFSQEDETNMAIFSCKQTIATLLGKSAKGVWIQKKIEIKKKKNDTEDLEPSFVIKIKYVKLGKQDSLPILYERSQREMKSLPIYHPPVPIFSINKEN